MVNFISCLRFKGSCIAYGSNVAKHIIFTDSRYLLKIPENNLDFSNKKTVIGFFFDSLFF